MWIPNDLWFVLSIVGIVTVSGCTVDENITCTATNLQNGVCRGVPVTGACNEEASAENITCTSTVDVSGYDELKDALNGASSGKCILLDTGTYGNVVVPAGVSLIGQCAREVKLEGVTLSSGQGSVLRGIEIGQNGLVIDGATDVRLESIHVNGSLGTGVTMKAGSKVSMVDSMVTGSSRYGIVGVDGVSLTVKGSVIAENQGSGIVMQCSAECDACTSRPMLSVIDSIVRDNRVGGIDVFSTDVTMNGVDIRGTLQGDSFLAFKGGGNLSVAACSNLLEARQLRLENAFSYGALVDASFARFGHVDDAEGSVAIRGNEIGLWVQNGADGSTSEMHGGLFEDNRGVGLGIKGETQAWIFCKGKIMNTAEVSIPTDGASSEPVGHGIVWRDKASVKIEDVTVSASARVPVLIDGPLNPMGSMASELKNLTLTGGDDMKGIWQQNLPMGGLQPTVTNAPAIQTDMAEKFAVPKAPVLTAVVP